jgi:TolB-like protein
MWRLLVVVGLMAPAIAAGGEYRRLAVIPFDNVARAPSVARALVMEAVGHALRTKGYDVIDGAKVDRELDARRIRFLDSVTASHASGLLHALDADALVVGSLLAYDASDRDDPQVALVTRVLDARSSLLWSGAVSASGAATERSFGTGRVRTIEELAKRAVADMYANVPTGDLLGAAPLAPRERPRRVRVFRSAEPLDGSLAISVLPFENFTKDRDVTRVFEKIVLHQLARRDAITVAEPAEVRRTFPSGKGYLPSRVPAVELDEASKSIGTRFVLTGAVFAFARNHSDRYGSTPVVDVYLCLTDTATGRIRWSGIHRRVGRDYEGALQRGAILDPVSLAHVVVDELVGAFTNH